MVSNKSLEEVNLFAALLHDVHRMHGDVFNTSALRKTLTKVRSRYEHEGIGFLTKTLPALGRCFDKALAGERRLNHADHNFAVMKGTELPIFLGEFFKRVLASDGTLLHDPCTKSVSVIRQLLGIYSKYKLPYTDEQEQKVLDSFKKAEEDVANASLLCDTIRTAVEASYPNRIRTDIIYQKDPVKVARNARILLAKLFRHFDYTDIVPRHGPGAVATRQKLWSKYRWSNVSRRITNLYPFDAYFQASVGHVCDSFDKYSLIKDEDLPARVILVPKDSRGPRLISAEPVDFQWIQQGLHSAIVHLVEHEELTKFNVFFTDQGPNQRGAILGSRHGRYSTLDLKEASDRVSLGLVRLLFPDHITMVLEACRSLSTVLPDGKELKLQKFAPMGSALCFPVLALTIWSILTGALPDADKITSPELRKEVQDLRDSILVYGDDVVVPTAIAADAIELLESFGLLVNRDKSCTKGLFRESCGVDAFKGINVTPLKLRTVWSSSRSPGHYCSYIEYANTLYNNGYYNAYDTIVEGLHQIYGAIPDKSMNLTCPSLIVVDEQHKPKHSRTSTFLQKREYRVWDVKAPRMSKMIDGWAMLLRYFTEGRRAYPDYLRGVSGSNQLSDVDPFSSSQYTSRRTSMLVRRWR